MSSKRVKKQKIVTIGGGTGSFMLLSGLRLHGVDLTAIVSMADDGGSTGVLRDELGVLPPGDIRQCLVALSGSSQTLRDLFNYRFADGGLSGHSFGNLFLSTLEKLTGSFDEAVDEAGAVLGIQGKVVPVTLDNINLRAHLHSGATIEGEHNINSAKLDNLKKLELSPRAGLNPKARQAIHEADKIIINPGNLFCSIIPNLLVDGIKEALLTSSAKKIYVVNLMNKPDHTRNYTSYDYVSQIEKYLKKDFFDYIIVNKEMPTHEARAKYMADGEELILPGDITRHRAEIILEDLLNKEIYEKPKGDKLARTLIRHDNKKLAELIIDI